jgi:pilus assembly protein Flp/PilA
VSATPGLSVVAPEKSRIFITGGPHFLIAFHQFGLMARNALGTNLAIASNGSRKCAFGMTYSYPRTYFVKTLISYFKTDRSGVTAIEYALMAASIAGAIMGAVLGLGSDLQTTFSSVSSAVGPPPGQASAEADSSESGSSNSGSSNSESRHRRSTDRRSWEGPSSDDDHSFDHDRFHR